MSDEVNAVICGECDDAPAVTKAWFNGRTLVDLCQECADWWANHALIEPKDDAHLGGGRASEVSE